MKLIENGHIIEQPQWSFDLDSARSISEFIASPYPDATVIVELDSRFTEISDLLHLISTIIIPFESFADGRFFSIARQLRQSYKYQQRIVAQGPMIADQYGLAIQCGIDAVLIDDELAIRQPIHLWQQALEILPVRRTPNHQPDTKQVVAPSNSTIKPETVNVLNSQYQNATPEQLLGTVLNDASYGRTAIVSSFGAESAVLLHLVATINPHTPILFIDTDKHFPETLAYKDQLTSALGLTNVITIKPDESSLSEGDADGLLHMTNTTSCCYLRKVLPLERALSDYDTWISGRKSFHSASRNGLSLFEQSGSHLKINPLANWNSTHLAEYINKYNLPKHPLISAGYTSIGCAPCTTPTAEGELPRAGRWRNEDKTECGIHFIGGQVVRQSHLI